MSSRDDGARLGDRIDAAVERREIDDVQQQPRALQMAQEAVPEAGAVGRALDEPGNVGDDEAAVGIDADDAEIRGQGRERVVGDVRPRGRDGADERRFAGVGHAEQADVGEDLEFQLEAPLFAGGTRRRLARRAVGARLEMQIAEAALAALGDQRARSVRGEVGDELAAVGVGDHRADRHAQNHVGAAAPVLIRAAAVLAALGAMDARVAVIDQRIDVAVGQRIDAAAAPAVAAVGPAARNVLLAAERDRAVAAVAGDHLDQRFVEEFHDADGATLPLEEDEALGVVAAAVTLPHLLPGGVGRLGRIIAGDLEQQHCAPVSPAAYRRAR